MTRTYEEIMQDKLAEFVQTNEEVAEEAYSMLHKRYLNPKDVWGYHWGFAGLDEKTGGIKWEGTREVTFVGARPGVGKSSFGVAVSITVGEQFMTDFPGLEVRIILLEMEPTECYMRLVSQIAGVPLGRMQRGNYVGDEWQRVEFATRSLKKLPIRWMRGRHNVENISAFVHGEHKGKACGYWLVDHIGIVPTREAYKSGNQSFALGEVSGALLNLARNVAPGMVLTQLNRETDKRADPTPRSSDVYGSDRILQDADNLILLDRPDTRTRTAEDERPSQEVAFLLIEKQRSGPSPTKVPVLFLPEYSQWVDMPNGGK